MPREREHDGGQVGGGVAVRERAAERAAVADLRVADLTGRGGEERRVLAQHRVVLDVVVAREPADGERVAVVADVRQVVAAGRRRRAPTAWPGAAS